MSESWESKLPDSDMQAVPKALVRAAKRAREIARPLLVIGRAETASRKALVSGSMGAAPR